MAQSYTEPLNLYYLPMADLSEIIFNHTRIVVTTLLLNLLLMNLSSVRCFRSSEYTRVLTDEMTSAIDAANISCQRFKGYKKETIFSINFHCEAVSLS